MDAIVSILRAAHCKSTHHYFAIDSLWKVATLQGTDLANLLLAHFGSYLQGAKDPDNVFKDFENHVVHVSDGYWGGAAKTAKKWLEKSHRLLSIGNWKDAAYAIGVLSHYFTDPFMPLHTAQSPRESIVHRPLEWSVCCSYQEIYAECCSNEQLEIFEIPNGVDWLTDAIHLGATFANQYYDLLIDDYNMNEASRFPKLALGSDSRRVLAKLFVAVHTGWASVLDRIACEAAITLPKTPLTLPTILAGVQVPTKKIVQAIESAERRAEVQNILDEYLKTGKVVRNASIEQRTIQSIRKQKPDLRPSPQEIKRAEEQRQFAAKVTEAVQAPPIIIAPPAVSAVPLVSQITQPANVPSDSDAVIQEAAVVKPIEKQPDQIANAVSPSDQVVPSKRIRLSLGSPIVDAPAIGPKTAARFEAIGCKTIEEFLESDPAQLVNELKTSWINGRLVTQWQRQALLACQIDRMTSLGSGLLVLAGIENANTLAQQNPIDLHSRLVWLANTSEGKRLLRDQEAPMLKTIERWVASAKATKVAPELHSTFTKSA
jgi:Domain of unknown function (DUF4332)